ncbi:MAG: VTT domain-containing protein [Candidatus Nitrosoabyssus spongiisocia]|nr:MAG: VTT domain-containing protein [Nitrosopumilaceae archaeon AB1(1)]
MDIIDLIPISSELGYTTLALVSFFGSLVPFIPLPFFIFLVTMSVGDQFNLHLLVLISAITSAGAKQIIFMLSYSGRRIIKESTKQRMLPFQRLVKRYGAAAAFGAAATPIPDDIIYIPLGLAKYNPWKFFIATFVGKVVLSYILVLSSHYFGRSLIEPYIQELTDLTPLYVGFIIFVASLLLIVYLMLRLDWARILGKIAPWTLDESLDSNEK